MLRDDFPRVRCVSFLLLVCALLGMAPHVEAQTRLVGWGVRRFDSTWNRGPFAAIEAGEASTLARRLDGTYVVWGTSTAGLVPTPTLPVGTTFVQVVHTNTQCFGLRSDGLVNVWPGQATYNFGSPVVKLAAGSAHVVLLLADGTLRNLGNTTYGQGTFPALPPGTTYVDVAAGTYHSLAERSDGVVVAFGSETLGAIPPLGRTFVQISAGLLHSVGLLDDGTCVAWGSSNSLGQLNVPPLPSGVTYTKIDAGASHTVALRSDGTAIAWGSNTWGACTLPSLPLGMTYTDVSASGVGNGGYSMTVLMRSDGELIGAGYGGFGHFGAPSAPAGVEYVGVSASRSKGVIGVDVVSTHVAALRSDGQAVVFGDTSLGRGNVPALPPGLAYVEVDAGSTHSLARRSDGTLLAFGSNFYDESTVPALPPGTSYVQSAADSLFSCARRSDGAIVSFGYSGQVPPAPALPPGVTYVKVDTGYDFLVGLRSDGQIAAWGPVQQNLGQLAVPPLPPGTTYVDVAAGVLHALALRSDGVIVGWGFNSQGQASPPALPPGANVAQLAASYRYSAALLQSGSVVVWGNTSDGLASIPALDPGERIVSLAAGEENLVAIVRRDWTAYGTGKTNSLGCVPTIRATGVPRATQNSGFVIECTAVQNQTPGMLVFRVNGARASVPFQCGTLLIGPSNLQRTPLRNSGGSAFPALDCTGIFSFDLSAFAAGLAGGSPDPALQVPGTKVNVQWWGRDAGYAPPCNTMLSDALEFTIVP